MVENCALNTTRRLRNLSPPSLCLSLTPKNELGGRPETQVIILTAHDTLSNAIESIKRGAYHFISKPYASEELLSLVGQALEKQSLLRETEELRQRTQQLEKRLEIAETRAAPIFKSKAMQRIE